jgi:CheY-like chemotaxis protein
MDLYDRKMLLRSPPTPDVSPPTVSGPPAAVLVVSDDPEVRDFLMEVAIEEGYGVRCAVSEPEAATILRHERPGLVIGDLDMASRTGEKFLRAIGRSEADREIARFGVTSSNDTMIGVSMDAPVFFKPELHGLREAVARLFRTRR